MAHHRLSARAVQAKADRGRYADGGGLFLQVSKWRTKSWIFRYERNGRERHMGLGALHTLSLAEARDRALECRRLLLKGRDPIEARNAEHIEATRGMTFKACAEQHNAAHEAGWRNEKHRAQWGSTLAMYAYPVIGDLPVSAIDTALVLKCIEPIWKLKPQTAKRVRGRIESILDWATVRGFRQGDNPARWRGHIAKLLPSPNKVRSVKHHGALPYPEIAHFMTELRARDGGSARALELTVLTALRTGEVMGARWSEFDLAARIWTVPAARMKTGREHRVPLSPPALNLLRGLPRAGEYLFPGRQPGQPLWTMAMRWMLRSMSRGNATVHGFRSTFRDWAAETTAYPNHVIEMALAHAIGDKVEAAYRRGDLFEKRRRLMDEWARYCSRPAVAAAPAKVVPLKVPAP
jgi:integrase